MKSNFAALLFLALCIFEKSPASELLCLENLAQDFVLESKQIYLPQYPHAFNPSIIRWRDRLLLSFRVIPNPKSTFDCELGVVWLDDEFNPISEPQLLNLRDECSVAPSRAEDARLIAIEDHLLMVYSDNPDKKISRAGFRVYISELLYDGDHFHVANTECFKQFKGESPNKREKNWVPFDYDENLLLSYSISPHVVFNPLFGAGACETAFATSSEIPWEWGELRGGTTALLNNGQYLAFFHSSVIMSSVESEGKNLPHYFMGAYTFCAEPPFALTQISSMPIIGHGYYIDTTHYQPYWKPLKCIFPCGFVFDEQYIWIAFGKQDHELWISKLDKQSLLQSLVPLNLSK
jgi:predicted GH43/DUF377 family glycosyl hydrolase